MHIHVDCCNNERTWLPYEPRGDRKFLTLHPWCSDCGEVKYIGPDRGKGIGYYVNILSDIKKRKKKAVTDVQMRLIVKELEGIHDFEDFYTMSLHSQERIFVDAVARYTNLREEFIEDFL
jgi:hypothetical protein